MKPVDTLWRDRGQLGRILIVAMAVLIALAIVGALIPAEDEETTQTTETTETTETDACARPPSQFVLDIEEGLTVSGGGTLRDAWYVEVSADLQNTNGWPSWLLAADLEGSGLEGTDDVVVWATGANQGLVLSVDEVTREFSEWGIAAQPGSPARDIADALRDSDEYGLVRDCVTG